MKSKNIKFVKEFCFTATLDDAENIVSPGLIDFQIPRDDLFVRTGKNDFAITSISAEIETVLSELHSCYGRSLLRIDKIDGSYISFSLLEFSESQRYDQENPLRIVVDQALSKDLRDNNIEQANAVRYIQRQLIVEESGQFCFAYPRNDKSEALELIGDKYSFTITETPQHYLHIVQIRRRTNRSRIDSPVTLISGSIEIVDELTDRAILTARANEQYSKLIGSDTEFIQLWNVYNDLEMESIKQQASEMGYLKYKNFHYSEGMIIFELEGGYTRREFCVDDMYYVAVPSINIEEPMEYNIRSATIIGSEIDYSCINTTQFRIKEDMDTTKKIPAKGFLLPSVSGSAVQKKRREKAEKNIISNKCALSGLKNIIQGGAQVGVIGRKSLPISRNLEREVFESGEIHFTEKQKNAIDVAINTPDIAIIQGPPGTGKTTIIKAIVKRIDELEKSKAKILITSTQHDAVDNAVEEINYGGVPVNRVSVRKGKEEDNLIIYDWIDKMISSCEHWLIQKDGSDRGTVRELFEKLMNVEESNDFSEQYDILLECESLIQKLNLSPNVNSRYAATMAELEAIVKTGSTKLDADPLPELIKGQRLTTEAFLDDGIIQLKQLEQYLKYDSNINFEIPDYWKKLKRITEYSDQLDSYLGQLKEDCERLEKLCPMMASVNDDLLKKDILDLIKALRLEVVSKGDDRNSLVANLIWEFKQELTNSSNVDAIIRAYSKINAATCQQSANPHISASMAGFNEEYDYVIVDEAARSNPLDLLIPMSMGKKIILVGDHKQLPHMVERDVVEAVVKKTGNSKVGDVLEESLFMRLNDAVSREDKKHGFIRTAMLTEQYRMHPDICELVNIFYNGQLKSMCKREDKEHGLKMYGGKALAWIDMPLSDEFPAEDKKQSVSRKCEVDTIQKELAIVLARNTDYKIGIITFYSAQAKMLNDMVQKNFPGDVGRIRVGTVDAFQGKEFDVVFLSIVRSNREREMRKRVGFLDNENRLCVAFSRAKRLLVAVGDASTVACDGEREYVKPLHEMYLKCQAQEGAAY